MVAESVMGASDGPVPTCAKAVSTPSGLSALVNFSYLVVGYNVVLTE